MGIIAIVLGVVGGIIGFVQPVSRDIQQTFAGRFRNMIPDITLLAQMYAQENLPFEEFYESAAKLGYAAEWLTRFHYLFQQNLPIADVIRLYFRGEIEKDQYQALMKMNRVGHGTEEIYLKAMEYYPTPQDMIRFAVREVYEPEQIASFGLREDFPEEFVKDAAKVGMTEETAEKFWMSHWNMPSIQMGFEMLHRGVINKKEMLVLFKGLDIVPKWRDYLTEISYNPLTRVDVRRMYRLGVLDRKAVLKSYTNLGYNDENAEIMTEFTEKYESNEDVGLTRSTVIKAFKNEIISIEKLEEYLYAIGYSKKVVEFWLSTAVYEKTEEEVKLYTTSLVEQYKTGQLSVEEIKINLTKLDVPYTYIDKVIKDLLQRKALKYKSVSRETLTKWLEQKIIGESKYILGMKKLGYIDSDIQNYLLEIELDGKEIIRKYLSNTVYIRFYTKDLLTREELSTIFFEKNISEEDIEDLLYEAEEAKDEYLAKLTEAG